MTRENNSEAVDRWLKQDRPTRQGARGTRSLSTERHSGSTHRGQEFVLLDENNQRAAVLESIGGRSALRFYAGNSAPALEMGVEKSRTVKSS